MLGSDGRPPTLRDIGEGVRPERPLSKSHVNHHLNYLEEYGLIERLPIDGRRKRVIHLPGARFVAPPMPVIGEQWAVNSGQ
jgi:SOS-response transcriptional repressor LexA